MEQILQQYGIQGLVLLMVGQFVYTWLANSRTKTKVEADTTKRLDERHLKIVALMDERLKERDSQLNALQRKIEEMEKREADSQALVDDLTGKLEFTQALLMHTSIRASHIPRMSRQINQMSSTIEQLNVDLKIEKELRDKADRQIENLEKWNDRANDDNAALIRKLNRTQERVKDLEEENTRLNNNLAALGQMMMEITNEKESKADDRRSDNAIDPSRVDGDVLPESDGDLPGAGDASAPG